MMRLREEELAAAESVRLERGLLPSPLLAGSVVRARSFYRSGRTRSVIGGDFFDAVLGPSGTVHAIVGDVCGHGPDEAALGALLRVSWRALVLAGVDEPQLLPKLQQVLVSERHDRSLFTTAATFPGAPALALPLAAVLSALTGGLVYVALMRPMAGHPIFAAVLVTVTLGILLRAAIVFVFTDRTRHPLQQLGLTNPPRALVGGAVVSTFDLVMVGAAVLLFAALFVFLKVSPLGRGSTAWCVSPGTFHSTREQRSTRTVPASPRLRTASPFGSRAVPWMSTSSSASLTPSKVVWPGQTRLTATSQRCSSRPSMSTTAQGVLPAPSVRLRKSSGFVTSTARRSAPVWAGRPRPGPPSAGLRAPRMPRSRPSPTPGG